jgi:hypothetical protein
MTQMVQIAAYLIWVGCSFAFIACVPAAESHNFLSTYAAGSFAASMFSIPIYTNWRSRGFDILFSAACIVSIFGLVFGHVYALYIMAAIALNIVDFSVAQSKNEFAVVVMRVIIGGSALAIFVNFTFGLSFRLALCAIAIIWSTFHKDYGRRETGWFSAHKAGLTLITCSLYYIPLSLIPYMSNQAAKFVYILYALSGSIILKIQDYIIKMNVSRGTALRKENRTLYFSICATTILILAICLFMIKPWLVVLSIPIAGLVATIWIVDNVSWA